MIIECGLGMMRTMDALSVDARFGNNFACLLGVACKSAKMTLLKTSIRLFVILAPEVLTSILSLLCDSIYKTCTWGGGGAITGYFTSCEVLAMGAWFMVLHTELNILGCLYRNHAHRYCVM